MIYYSLILLAIWNLFVLFLYGADKSRAKNNKYRFSERCLLLCTFLLGGVGGVLGVFWLRHKSRHLKFVIGAPLALVLQVTAAVGVTIYFYQ